MNDEQIEAELKRKFWEDTEPPTTDEARRHFIAWYDNAMDADIWWGLASVTPREAAMLLCEFNPNDDTCNPLTCTNLETKPDDFKRLLRVFKDVKKTDPTARTLRQWLAVARDKPLKYHSWIDAYALARNEDSPADSGSERDAVIVGGGGTAKKPGPKPGQHRQRMAKILDALKEWATAQSLPFDCDEMPGKVGRGPEEEGGFHWFCATLHRDFRKGKGAFENHRAGLCRFPPGAKASDFYRNALADISGKLKSNTEFSVPTQKRRKPA